MGDSKGKKPSQGPSTDSDMKKKNMKCHYYKKKGHVKLECRKLRANQAAGTVSENKRVEGSKTQTASRKWKHIYKYPLLQALGSKSLTLPSTLKCEWKPYGRLHKPGK